MKSLEDVIQINLGEGKVGITAFSDVNGHGLVFKDNGVSYPIGSPIVGEKKGLCVQEPGEVYIHCSNKASVLVLLEQLSKVLECFKEEEG